MGRIVASIAAGALFAAGLGLSGMAQPSKVLGFLDVTGPWDPSLAFVMAGAIAIYAPVARWAKRREQPILGGRFVLPERTELDARLLVGAALFGVGWGLAGYCPGPAIVASASGQSSALLLLGAMLLGMWAHDLLHVRSQPALARATESGR